MYMEDEPQAMSSEKPAEIREEVQESAQADSLNEVPVEIPAEAAASSNDMISNDTIKEATAEPPRFSRPFRVKLRGSVLVLVRLPNKRDVRAAIHQLSITGGVVHIEKPLDEKLKVEMIFHIGGKTIREKAQMLFPMWATQGWMQPFRFVELSEESRQELDRHLKTYIGSAGNASEDASKSATAGA